MMETLTTKQRSHLRSLAHPLKPLLHIGKEGVTETALRTIKDSFNTRELLKLKVLESAPENARESGELMAERLEGVRLVQVIGRTVVLYRRHPEKPEIKFPR
ncbi:MAG: ribosome assembly RNA-binding protein YhbY [Pyrinomonadaceae bacterium]|nr:ribosome assembly RNA-binding protein YhbY [Pyrinomonadaceae bacterium]